MPHPCPCGSKQNYVQCCAPVIGGQQPATTAEMLMRSRYSAFTQCNVDYILRTYHSKTRPTRDRAKILAWAKSVKWLGLTVLDTQMGLEDNEMGYVEFRAMYNENGTMGLIHEKSLFKREKGHWVYVSGEHR
jgi:SEC-C motif-containing protein